ncbi:flagellar hook-length control protein FliK [Lysinibacillus sp. 2017]|uniref:flagellar hook-length control protein FliK n=1 Tax=unclassified Lysinibacillus TaxID=2636778 RepID=UPI000D5270C3|nr:MULTISPECIES: flagellar hook-length control protein FliK [unclassified Lysinibacillus]AWE06678.1 flagellar hook-length control protein FliK [Lysinibacillus sp. 2017]TGN37390.1 flagellar hook-length control protein FliK [Lysinibacillus sp. S2017]
MNIAMLQAMSATKVQQPTVKSNSVETSTPDANAFGSVFQSIMSTSKPVTPTETPSTDSLAEGVTAILSTDSLESLLDELGVEMDEAGLFIFVGEEGNPVPVDEILTLENLTELLGTTEEELTKIVQQLLGETEQEITDVWSIIEQAPAILSEILAMIQGTQQNQQLDVQPKEVQQVVQFLKLAQLFGNKVDTVYQQEVQLNQLTEALANLATQAQAVVTTQQQEAPKATFQQVVQQVMQQGSTQQTTVKTETETQSGVGLQQQTTQTKTVTVTLPAEKPAQSEALVKEIQNLINRSQISGQQGNMKLFLKLFPENLGQIRIELVQKDGVFTARILATTAHGKELLENNLNQLKAGFVAQNIQMDRIDVAQSLQDADRNTRDQSFLNNFFGRQEQDEVDENEEDNEDEKVSFKDLLSEEVE